MCGSYGTELVLRGVCTPARMVVMVVTYCVATSGSTSVSVHSGRVLWWRWWLVLLTVGR